MTHDRNRGHGTRGPWWIVAYEPAGRMLYGPFDTEALATAAEECMEHNTFLCRDLSPAGAMLKAVVSGGKGEPIVSA